MFESDRTVCNITFPERENGVFCPSEILKCNVELITQKPKTLKDVSVIVSGISKVKWSVPGQKHSTYYGNWTDHFASTAVLKKNENGSTFELEPGRHTYYFEMVIPPKLPATFESYDGKNFYEITVILNRKFRSNKKFVTKFDITCPLDLNENNKCRIPIDVTEEKRTFFKVLEMAPFKMRVQIPRSGYIAGQKIPCQIDVVNESKVNCTNILVTFRQYALNIANCPAANSRQNQYILVEEELPGVMKSNRRQFVSTIEVPHAPSTSQDESDIIIISYAIFVEAVMEGVHGNVEMDIPIILGTVPLVESVAPIVYHEVQNGAKYDNINERRNNSNTNYNWNE